MTAFFWLGMVCIAMGLSASICRAASPWIPPGDQLIRHHLQTLVDAKLINTTITTWPLMWNHLKQCLDDLDASRLTRQTLPAFQYLRYELHKATQTLDLSSKMVGGNQPNALGDFSADHRELIELQSGIEWTQGWFSGKFNAGYAHNPFDEDQRRFDGSYVSSLLGNWSLGVGALDRWWGPGWDSSLILSHNARPIPALFIQRNSSEPFETPWLSWIGPWQLLSFLGALEAHRDFDHAKLWGMRINFRPLQSLEVGLSRTAQFGGDNRPEDLKTLLKMLTGQDNRGDDNLAQDGLDEPGNQLAGFDLRWGYTLGTMTGGLYGQLIGEDEAGGLPSRHIGMLGAEWQFELGHLPMRWVLEGQNTTMYFYDHDKKAYDSAYEHALYNWGYRFHYRSLGSSADNDSETYSLKGQFFFNNDHYLSLKHSRILLNADQKNAPPPGGSRFAGSAKHPNKTELSYSLPVGDNTKLELGISHYADTLIFNQRELGTAGYINIQMLWQP